MKRPAIAFAIIMLIVTGGVAAYSALGANEHPDEHPVLPAEASDANAITRVGDLIWFHMRLYDNRAQMLYSTKIADRPLLEAVHKNWTGDDPYLLPITTEDSPQRHIVQDGLAPIPFDTNAAVPVGASLQGKRVGDVVALPIVGRMEGWTQAMTIDRVRGPFNITMDAPRETLEKIATFDDDGRVHIDDVLVADVLSTEGNTTRLRFDVKDGDVLPITKPGFTGVVDVDEEAGTFRFTLQTEVGHRFSLLASCQIGRYVLPVGSYRVTDVTDAAIVLDHTPTKWPQLLGRDLMMIIEIDSIELQEDKELNE